MGTEKCAETLLKMRKHLEGRVDIRTGTDVKSLLVKDGKIEGVETTKGEKLYAKYAIGSLKGSVKDVLTNMAKFVFFVLRSA